MFPHSPGGAHHSLRTGSRVAALSAALAAVTFSAGCVGQGLSESSTCKDFLAASAQDQQSITQQLAGKYQKPDYATPLGMPEVPYYCSTHPNVTLKQFFSFAG